MKRYYFLSLVFLIFSCNDGDESQTYNDSNADGITIPLNIYQKIYKTTSDIYIQGDHVYINTDGVPDHKSPYFLGTQWESEKYEAYDGSNPFVTWALIGTQWNIRRKHTIKYLLNREEHQTPLTVNGPMVFH